MLHRHPVLANRLHLMAVKIIEQEVLGPFVITLNLPVEMPVWHAVAHQAENRNIHYVPGVIYGGHPISSASTYGHMTVLLEWPGGDGDLILYPNQATGTILLRLLSKRTNFLL